MGNCFAAGCHHNNDSNKCSCYRIPKEKDADHKTWVSSEHGKYSLMPYIEIAAMVCHQALWLLFSELGMMLLLQRRIQCSAQSKQHVIDIPLAPKMSESCRVWRWCKGGSVNCEEKSMKKCVIKEFWGRGGTQVEDPRRTQAENQCTCQAPVQDGSRIGIGFSRDERQGKITLK